MSETRTIPIGPGFNMDAMVSQLQQIYSGKGFYVTAIPYNSGVSVEFSKDLSGFKRWLGLGQGIRANMSISNGYLYTSFTDAEWTGKIVAIGVGWFMCLVPLITGIIGAVSQTDLPKNIVNDIMMLTSGSSAGPPPPPPGYQPPPPPPPQAPPSPPPSSSPPPQQI
ncbi:MAG: hypothetical protein FWD38_10440 [Oscillospiraceae bacterium]|nr:hypothetical protein [Oscillospiraceae bacterium]